MRRRQKQPGTNWREAATLRSDRQDNGPFYISYILPTGWLSINGGVGSQCRPPYFHHRHHLICICTRAQRHLTGRRMTTSVMFHRVFGSPLGYSDKENVKLAALSRANGWIEIFSFIFFAWVIFAACVFLFGYKCIRKFGTVFITRINKTYT